MYAGADLYLPLRSRPAATSSLPGVTSEGSQFLALHRFTHHDHLASAVGIVVSASSWPGISNTACSSSSTASRSASDPLPYSRRVGGGLSVELDLRFSFPLYPPCCSQRAGANSTDPRCARGLGLTLLGRRARLGALTPRCSQ